MGLFLQKLSVEEDRKSRSEMHPILSCENLTCRREQWNETGPARIEAISASFEPEHSPASAVRMDAGRDYC